jgi:hypothetical protein
VSSIDSNSEDDYEPDEKQARMDIDFVSIEYKINVASLVKEHPRWGLYTIQKHGGASLKSLRDLKRWQIKRSN